MILTLIVYTQYTSNLNYLNKQHVNRIEPYSTYILPD